MVRPDGRDNSLIRRLGLTDAIVIGLGSMIGAGVFAVFGPAAAVAGSGLLISLLLAGVVAFCNAISSARLAALYPESGGTYVYGKRRLGEFWGYLAGWSFVVGKTASCAAMALTFAAYAAPEHLRIVAVLIVVALTAVNLRGLQKSAWLTRLIVVLTLLTLIVVVVGAFVGGNASTQNLSPFPGGDLRGILQASGLIFFAFAGYARVATLGEEVRDPARTIPRAIVIALCMTLCVYAIVALAALLALGAPALAASSAPLHDVVASGELHRAAPLVQVGGAIAAAGSLLALILGVSRTTFAMARDGHFPRRLAAVHPSHGTPYRAELGAAAVIIVLIATVDLRHAIGFSSFGVLLYYAVANASALTLGRPGERRPARWLPSLGLGGCLLLVVSLPAATILAGVVVLLIGGVVWGVRARLTRQP
ncbi:amino acid/polyamine/organocation transporter (APC superfamily) [Jatrophihabitans sp. GAS493]|uniref:APC family permease n=1 Tax=Jatrophihabitans sp. GAS493 TaxID=1907575 RepID=UPI000BB9535D|nr:amino acid permease [Jatrophihabitans sp. GAS493]SOD73216.1 amino acid/polyamine/organocation transporter (APC superfamily) [Jatrophihabitans sp. GAS493]